MINKIKDFFANISNYIKSGFLSIVLILSGVLLLILLQGTIISSLAAIIANLGFGIGVLWAFDKFLLKDIDTLDEIKKGNIAFSILYLSWCIIISASILAT
jgi:hypothetical protein